MVSGACIVQRMEVFGGFGVRVGVMEGKRGEGKGREGEGRGVEGSGVCICVGVHLEEYIGW